MWHWYRTPLMHLLGNKNKKFLEKKDSAREGTLLVGSIFEPLYSNENKIRYLFDDN